MKKAEEVLRFIKKAGKSGRRFTEIQKFIFEKNHPNLKYDSSTTNRGYYCNCLSGTYRQKGLLSYCTKNADNKWTLTRLPKGNVYLVKR
tara:strand:- start:106 stop:372 length:267 start_codon:yes stop_codon:yes gene_type:complete